MKKCRYCEHCKKIGGTLKRGHFYCKHPDQEKINKYFTEKKNG